MPKPALAVNKCSWLPQGSKTHCGKNSYLEFCGPHTVMAKQGSKKGHRPCIGCVKGLRGKYQICLECGGTRYRAMLEYHTKKNKPVPAIEEFLMVKIL